VDRVLRGKPVARALVGVVEVAGELLERTASDELDTDEGWRDAA